MDKQNLHTTIFPYYDKEIYDYFYEVGKLHTMKRSDLILLLDTIGRKAEKFDVFQHMYNIHIQGDWKMVKESVLNDMHNAENMAYCIIESHMDRPVMKEDNFYIYLKKRIEEEFYGDIQFSICWEVNETEKIALVYSDIIHTKHIHINFP